MVTALERIFKKLENLENKIQELEKNLTTCVGEKCKVLDTEIKKVQTEHARVLSELDKAVKNCVGEECERIKTELGLLNKKIIEEINDNTKETVAQPSPIQTPPPKFVCPNCELPIEENMKECPHCYEPLKWEEIEE